MAQKGHIQLHTRFIVDMEVGSRIIERVSETEIQIQQQEMSDGFVKHLLVGKERTL